MKYIKTEKLSGYIPSNLSKLVQVVKKRDFVIVSDITIGGDAPKYFIKRYVYGKVKRKNTPKWIKYIAKTGHKWYPNESITEHLLNCIGKELGLFMSNSELAIIGGQLRLLSEYFLTNKKQELVHGADIFAGYISDKEMVEQIEEQQLARTFFTFQFAVEAIKFAFPDNYDDLVTEFIKLLIFDAIVGNNDRHFYNWGIVKSVVGHHKPYFSPIFDTARGLFWNESEQKINELLKQKQTNQYLSKYIKNSLPKTGWEGINGDLNHIDLVRNIKNNNLKYETIIKNLVSLEKEQNVLKMISSNFSALISTNRMSIILACLKLRFEQLRLL